MAWARVIHRVVASARRRNAEQLGAAFEQLGRGEPLARQLVPRRGNLVSVRVGEMEPGVVFGALEVACPELDVGLARKSLLHGWRVPEIEADHDLGTVTLIAPDEVPLTAFVEPLLREQAVEHAPGEGAMGAAALEARLTASWPAPGPAPRDGRRMELIMACFFVNAIAPDERADQRPQTRRQSGSRVPIVPTKADVAESYDAGPCRSSSGTES